MLREAPAHKTQQNEAPAEQKQRNGNSSVAVRLLRPGVTIPNMDGELRCGSSESGRKMHPRVGPTQAPNGQSDHLRRSLRGSTDYQSKGSRVQSLCTSSSHRCNRFPP